MWLYKENGKWKVIDELREKIRHPLPSRERAG